MRQRQKKEFEREKKHIKVERERKYNERLELSKGKNRIISSKQILPNKIILVTYNALLKIKTCNYDL